MISFKIRIKRATSSLFWQLKFLGTKLQMVINEDVKSYKLRNILDIIFNN